MSAWMRYQMFGFSSTYAPSKAHQTQGGGFPYSASFGKSVVERPRHAAAALGVAGGALHARLVEEADDRVREAAVVERRGERPGRRPRPAAPLGRARRVALGRARVPGEDVGRVRARGRGAAHVAPLLRQAPDPRAVLARLVALRPRRGRDAIVRGRNGREDQGENEGKSHEKLRI